jgi:hypothetical protein
LTICGRGPRDNLEVRRQALGSHVDSAGLHLTYRRTDKRPEAPLQSMGGTRKDRACRRTTIQTSEPKLGYPGGLATKRAADMRAQALLSRVREIQAAGFVRLKDITDELNRRGVPAARVAKGWYRSGVARLLTRLRALELKRTSDRAELATLRAGRPLPES